MTDRTLSSRRPLRRRCDGTAPVLAGQRAKEAHDEFDLLRRHAPAELAPGHRSNRLGERRLAAVVEIWSGDSDVAQAGHAEHMAVTLLAGDREAAEVGRAGLGPFGEYAEPLEEISADVHALVASDTAVALE